LVALTCIKAGACRAGILVASHALTMMGSNGVAATVVEELE
jgi:hypothetical protein